MEHALLDHDEMERKDENTVLRATKICWNDVNVSSQNGTKIEYIIGQENKHQNRRYDYYSGVEKDVSKLKHCKTAL